MLPRTLVGVFVVCVNMVACGRPVYHPPPAEVQLERDRLTARSQEYYAQQKERVERVGKRLLAQVPNPPNIDFLVLEGQHQVNAGATFGQVVVTMGMLHFMRTDDELAVVLSHEIGHHTQGHITKGLATGVVTSVAATAAAVVVGSVAPGTGPIAGNLIQGLANHFNQDQELEADAVGLEYVAAAGYDPSVAVEVFERMAVEVPQTLTAEFFSTHPSTPERVLAARKIVDSLRASGAFVPKPQPEPSTASSMHGDGEPGEDFSNSPVRGAATIRREFDAESGPTSDDKLRLLYRDFRAGRISEEDYEVRKRALLNSGE